jgi:hypothetical protein
MSDFCDPLEDIIQSRSFCASPSCQSQDLSSTKKPTSTLYDMQGHCKLLYHRSGVGGVGG